MCINRHCKSRITGYMHQKMPEPKNNFVAINFPSTLISYLSIR
ncbi:hypothetical protein ESA_01665 [Cronobacter sakazakii ATCC BAA-894]|uniref:Uncharacterized protein n=1 Tax=Cronobacter sakazakii (strain ATCC BAA-894) TaxID=290339 RepID=A7MGG8_CROS8|nr:hypothetical protein ESA_01665 [Cronobacter sakazakii ATCC BAA-894]